LDAREEGRTLFTVLTVN